MDELARERLITENEQNILRIASKAAGRYITKSDDEYSVALFAFSRAIDSYEDSKGEFMPYAALLIKRAVIDLYRSEQKYSSEVPVSPDIMEGNAEPQTEDDTAFVKASGDASMGNTPGGPADAQDIREEIITVNSILGRYGFTFFDLTTCSPKQDKTREQCARAVRYILKSPEAMGRLIRDRQLPVKAVSDAAGVSQKTLEKYRRYMIMAVIVLSGDYPCLASRLRFISRGMNG